MRIRVRFGSIRILLGAIVAATAMVASSARAGSNGCCNAPPFPEVIYAVPPAPIGYVLYPLERVRPFYVVNQGGPASFGAVIYARPSYSDGGYTFADDYPCVVSYGHGMRIFYRAWRAAATCPPGPYHAARYMDYRRKY
jgi:hypothetical protein